MNSTQNSSPDSSPSSSSSHMMIMDKDLHVTFIEMMYHLLPSPYESQEINHLTLAYFIISSLDFLNSLHLLPNKDSISNWVLSFHLHPITTTPHQPNNGQFYGFHGSRTSMVPPDPTGHPLQSWRLKNMIFLCCSSMIRMSRSIYLLSTLVYFDDPVDKIRAKLVRYAIVKTCTSSCSNGWNCYMQNGELWIETQFLLIEAHNGSVMSGGLEKQAAASTYVLFLHLLQGDLEQFLKGMVKTR